MSTCRKLPNIMLNSKKERSSEEQTKHLTTNPAYACQILLGAGTMWYSYRNFTGQGWSPARQDLCKKQVEGKRVGLHYQCFTSKSG